MMNRIVAFRFGEIAYFTFFAAVAHAVFFVENMVVPKTIDAGGPSTPVSLAIAINLLLLTIFAVQHSVMGRQGFKGWWTKLMPTSLERSAYVFVASLVLLALMWQWRPLPEVVWQAPSPPIGTALTALSFLGWLIVFTGNFAANHLELFSLQHIGDYVHDSVTPEPTPLPHRLARRLTYLGFIIAVWSAPIMTTGHLLFAFVTSVYMLVGAAVKQTDFIGQFGGNYRYRERATWLVPWRRLISTGTRDS